jgi:superfamily II RNA helicase
MVKICNNIYPIKNEEKYKEHFEKFSYELSSFQKYAIEAIIEEQHILITAHTGSGKTLPAEFAIEYLIAKGKKVIYTSPIKALSNQKYYEFTKKFPNISFGILTGDIKSNPEADVLIMTTEILQNILYYKKHNSDNTCNITNIDNTKSLAMFDIDIDNDLGCVIFDEVHYINDQDRGHCWEETIMMLPLHIQMVMLSATLDAPEKFALWCECRGNRTDNTTNIKKKVYLTTTYERVVPLTHYSFITCTQGIFKVIKDKALEQEIKSLVNKTNILQTPKGIFDEEYYNKIKKMLTLFENKKIHINQQYVVNQVCKYMVDNSMLPAIFFVFSRKQLEIYAKSVTVVLLEDDSKVPYIISHECEKIIRNLPNYEEYLQLPEYITMVKLLEKGIAIHHAGIIPVLREMVELLFAKGYVKVLFATETFAVGINMPTKTVVFTDIKKYSNSGLRTLYSHEYTQMAGRAGRRGIDTIGHVIHLNNLYKNIDLPEYKTMMQGKPQKLVSKFKISYNLIMNIIYSGDQNFLNFCKRSMIQDDIDAELGGIYYQITDLENTVEKLELTLDNMKTPRNIVERYISCFQSKDMASNKKRKELDKEINSIKDTYKTIENDKKIMEKYNNGFNELLYMKKTFENTEQYLNNNVISILKFLKEDGFIIENENKIVLTQIGFIATHLREVHCLVFAKLLNNNTFNNISAKQIVAIFSCFTNITISDEIKTHKVKTYELIDIIENIVSMYEYYQNAELSFRLDTGINYELHYELINYVLRWCDCETIPECKQVIQDLEKEKGIFLGEFVKAILKINNISMEIEKIVENIGNISLLSKLKEIPKMTLKFVATNQSLYI